MSNTGVAGGTYGADPVPARQKTAPDGSTVIGVEGPPDPPSGEQNADYPDPNDDGVDDATAEKAQG